MASIRKIAGVVAAALLLGLGIVLLHGPTLIAGIVIAALGAFGLFWQVGVLYRTRPDPYDLKRLFDEPTTEDEPEETAESEDLPYCYHCGSAVAKPFARCPQCGGSLR